MQTIYLDNNATTRPLPEVLEKMQQVSADYWANPSGTTTPSKQARQIVDTARKSVAGLIGASSAEIVFTSGGTESNNTAIRGIAALNPGSHFITSAIEHASVRKTLADLANRGHNFSELPVSTDGAISLSELEAAIRPETKMVSLMPANNETGVMLPIEEVSMLCRSRRLIFHVDAVQALGKTVVEAAKWSDFMSFSAHKIHGPKGVGAMYVRRHLKFTPLLFGGGQENENRAGTENVSGIAGFGVAAKSAASFELTLMRQNRDWLEETILNEIPCTKISCRKSPRLPNTTSLTVSGVSGKELVSRLSDQGIYISNGSACATGSTKPSHVLLALGLTPQEAMSTVRVSLSHETTREEIKQFSQSLAEIVNALRAK